MHQLDMYLQNSISQGQILPQATTGNLGRNNSAYVGVLGGLTNPNQANLTNNSLSYSMNQLSLTQQIHSAQSDICSKPFTIESWELETREPLIDMSFDWKGERVAIVTADRRVLIYNRTSEGKWMKNSEYAPHNGPIWKVKWAHDYLGNFLATCRQTVQKQAHMTGK